MSAIESKLRRNFLKLIIITFSGAFIYTLPYFRLYYYDAFREAFSLTNVEMGLCGTYFGIIGAVAYIVGGILSDKVPLRILMPISMISTGLLGLYLLTIPSPTMVIAVHAAWAFTALMAFYPAMMKSIRLLGDSDEQGRAFGLFEGGRGVINAAILAIAVGMYGYFTATSGNTYGIQSIILFYSSVTIGLGILNIFFLKSIDEENAGSENSFELGQIGTLLKMPALWIMIVIIFCTYMVNMAYYYIAPYTTVAFGASMVFAIVISSSSQYIRPFASIAGGFLADKINSSRCLLLAQVISLIGIIIILVTPTTSSIVFIIVGCLFVFSAMYVTQSMHFAIMEESDLPKESAGTAIGIVCFLGYLPESLTHLLAGNLLDMYPGARGYEIFFTVLAIVTVVGILATLLWISKTKEKRAQILSLSRAKREAAKAEKEAAQNSV